MLKQLTTKYIFGLIFIIFVVSDFVSKTGHHYRNDWVHTSQIAKGFFVLLAIFFIVKNYKPKYKTVCVSVISLFGIHCLGLLFLNSEYSFLENIKANIVILNWYLFIFVLFLSYAIYIEKYSEYSDAIISFLGKCFEWFFYLNLIAVIIGFLGNYELFSAYRINTRFGFIGLLRNVSHASYIAIIYVIYFYYSYEKNHSKKNLFNLFLALLFIFFLATKAVLLFFVLFVSFLLYKKSKLFLGGAVLLFILGIFLSKDFILTKFLPEYFPILYEVYKKDGLITMLTSLRSQQFTDLFIPYITEKWGAMNYLFGGLDSSIRKIEFEIVDFLLTFGIIGTAMYLFTFFKYIIPTDFIQKYVLLLALFVVVFLAGSFFSSIPVMTVFLVFFILISKKSELA